MEFSPAIVYIQKNLLGKTFTIAEGSAAPSIKVNGKTIILLLAVGGPSYSDDYHKHINVSVCLLEALLSWYPRLISRKSLTANPSHSLLSLWL